MSACPSRPRPAVGTKRLRLRLFSIAARISRHARRAQLRLADRTPWADLLAGRWPGSTPSGANLTTQPPPPRRKTHPGSPGPRRRPDRVGRTTISPTPNSAANHQSEPDQASTSPGRKFEANCRIWVMDRPAALVYGDEVRSSAGTQSLHPSNFRAGIPPSPKQDGLLAAIKLLMPSIISPVRPSQLECLLPRTVLCTIGLRRQSQTWPMAYMGRPPQRFRSALDVATEATDSHDRLGLTPARGRSWPPVDRCMANEVARQIDSTRVGRLGVVATRGQGRCSTSASGRRGVRTGGGLISAARPTRMSTCGSARRPVIRRTNSRLACISIIWVKVQVAKPVAVHSKSTRESASPHRSVFSRLSS